MPIKLDVPNLDHETLDPEELAEFAKHLTQLAAYADVKAEAMRFRLKGEIRLALARERHCQMLYELLPSDWKW